MQKSEKFFIFTWKELTVIALLAMISMGFFFTLGLHYGKKLPGAAGSETAHETGGKLAESAEALPPREALEQGAQHSGGATEDSIKEATESELKQSNVKLESPKQVDLPGDKKSGEEAAAEKPDTAKPETAEPKSASTSLEKSRYAIQLGSYPSRKEAQLKIKTLQKRGLHTEIRTATVNGMLRFRVVIPGFARKAQADLKGRELAQKHKVDTFIVIKD